MTSVRDLLRAGPDGSPLLPRIDPLGHPGIGGKREALRELEATALRFASIQDRLFAEHTRGVLVILQGMDTSGKGGVIKHVFRGVNPAGCRSRPSSSPPRRSSRITSSGGSSGTCPTPGRSRSSTGRTTRT